MALVKVRNWDFIGNIQKLGAILANLETLFFNPENKFQRVPPN